MIRPPEVVCVVAGEDIEAGDLVRFDDQGRVVKAHPASAIGALPPGTVVRDGYLDIPAAEWPLKR